MSIIETALDLSQHTRTTVKNDARIHFYCDEDSRWRHATNNEVPGNEEREDSEKAWYDPSSEIIYDVAKENSHESELPGCRGSGKTLAETYCNWKYSQIEGSRCAVTLCNLAISRPFLSLADLQDKDLSENEVEPVVQAHIDQYDLLSSTIVHEV